MQPNISFNKAYFLIKPPKTDNADQVQGLRQFAPALTTTRFGTTAFDGVPVNWI